MRVLARARVDQITDAGVWALTPDWGRLGPLEALGGPAVGQPALLAVLNDTGDMVLLCGVDGLIDRLKAAVAAAGSWAAFQTEIASW